MSHRGFGIIEVVAAAGYLLMQYVSSTATTVEKLQQDRPLPRAKLAADPARSASRSAAIRAADPRALRSRQPRARMVRF